MEVPTPPAAEKNVFKRLFKDRSAEARMNSTKSSTAMKTENQKKMMNKTTPAKGRQVSSKFSTLKENQPLWGIRKVVNTVVPKQETQGLHVSKKFAPKTPATTSQLKQVDGTPPTVRLARSKLHSARYWLSLIGVAEKAGKHDISMKLFELAVKSGAQPAADLHKSWTAYKNRYQIPEENKDEAADSQLARCDPLGTQTAAAEIRPMEKVADCESESVIAEETTNGLTMKNLYTEVYSEVSISSVDSVSQVLKVPEPVNGDTTSNSPPKLPSSEAVLPRRTPRRACAIRAALKLEESAKKSTRRKARKNDTAATTSTLTDVENMNVNMLMKEVVSGVLSDATFQPEPLRDPKSAKKTQQPRATAGASLQVKAGPVSDKKTKEDTDAFPVINEELKAKWTRPGTNGAANKSVTTAERGTRVPPLGADDKDTKAGKQSEMTVGAKCLGKKAAAGNATTEGIKCQATPEPRRSARLFRSTTASRGSSHD